MLNGGDESLVGADEESLNIVNHSTEPRMRFSELLFAFP